MNQPEREGDRNTFSVKPARSMNTIYDFAIKNNRLRERNKTHIP